MKKLETNLNSLIFQDSNFDIVSNFEVKVFEFAPLGYGFAFCLLSFELVSCTWGPGISY